MWKLMIAFMLTFMQGRSLNQPSANLIKNGGFDLPAIRQNSYFIGNIPNWIGSYMQIDRYTYFNGTMNQFVDMQGGISQNSYLEQSVVINYTADCTITYKQKANTTTYGFYVLNVYWNYVLLATKIANTTSVTLETFQVQSVQGINVLTFKEVGNDTDKHGMFIDDVFLTCIQIVQPLPSTPNTTSNSTQLIIVDQSLLATYRPFSDKQVYSLSFILSLPFRSKPSFRPLYLFVGDLWLYNYGKREHHGLVNDIFNTITVLELLKFRFLDNFLGFAKYAQQLPLSNYTQYTLRKFIEIEGSESVLITSNFTFFIYSIPQNLIVCFLLYATFIITSDKKISRHLRVFYFLRTVLAQNLVEANLGYLVYVCFSHLSHPFCYKFADKISLILTISVFFLLVVFSFTFYFLLSSYLSKYSGYFMYFYYRIHPGVCVLMGQSLVRNFLQGAAHFFLYNYYHYLMLTLSCIELPIMAWMIILQNRHKVFVSSISFCLQLFYHFLFILFNFSLYFQYLCSYKYQGYEELKDFALRVEDYIVFTYFVVLALMFVNDFMPRKCIPLKKQKLERIQKIKYLKSTKTTKKGNPREEGKQGKEKVKKSILVKRMNGISKNNCTCQLRQRVTTIKKGKANQTNLPIFPQVQLRPKLAHLPQQL